MYRMFAWRWSLLVLALLAGPADAAIIAGRNYTALADWASANGLRLRRAGSGDHFIATNRTQRLVFDKDSRMVEVNGVNVALSFPIAVDKGAGYISQLDLIKSISPLISAPAGVARKITTICLDPGHGGKDTGNRAFGRSEKTYTLLLAAELQRQLQAAGFTVFLTRSQDDFLKLPARPEMANRRKADLFVSLHFNGAPVDPARVDGVETYCITPVGASSSNAQGEGANHGPVMANGVERKSLLLAYQVHKALVRGYGADDRGVRRARLAVLRDAEMPAILVESGYLSNPVEARKIFDPNCRRQIAAAIVKGIVNYQKLTGAPPAAQPAPPKVTSRKTSTPKAAGKKHQ